MAVTSCGNQSFVISALYALLRGLLSHINNPFVDLFEDKRVWHAKKLCHTLQLLIQKRMCKKKKTTGVFWVHLIDLDVPSYKILLMQIAFSRQGLQYRQDFKFILPIKS